MNFIKKTYPSCILIITLMFISGCITQQLPINSGDDGVPSENEENGISGNNNGNNPIDYASGKPALLHVVEVTASDHSNEHIPANTLDKNLYTRWSASGRGAWIRFDLGDLKTLTAISIAWYKGDERVARFGIEVSNDAILWNHVYDGYSNGQQLDAEKYQLPQLTARYVRIIGYGNSSNMWNSITEVQLWGYNGMFNNAPLVSGAPASIAVIGEEYLFRPNVTDTDGDSLLFNIENQPSWTRFDASTGVLRGTPGENDIGTFGGIVISVTDGWEDSRIGPFSIAVQNPRDEAGSIPYPSISRNLPGMIEETFEDGEYWDSGFIHSGNPPIVSSADSHPVFEGTHSLQIFLDRNDRGSSPSPYRREIKLVNNNAGAFKNLKYNKEYWIGFAIYLADDYKMPNTSDILFQLHDVPDKHIGESYKNPNLTLRVAGLTRKEDRKSQVHQWLISVKGDHREFTPTGSKRYYPTQFSVPVGPAEPDVGRWVTWVFNFRNSYNPDGFIKVWKDGKLVLERHQIRTAFNDVVGPYVNLGSYKPDWKRPGDSKNPYLNNPWQNPFASDEHPSRLSYVDAFRIAVGNNRYDDVAP